MTVPDVAQFALTVLGSAAAGGMTVALAVGKRVRRIEQSVYGDNGESLVESVRLLRKDMHWANNSLTVLFLHNELNLPERPSSK